MKKLLIAGLVGVVLVGGGCVAKPVGPVETTADGTSIKPAEKVEGVWHLAFDLPKGWVMVPQYDEDMAELPTAFPVNNQMTDVVLQSTDKPIALTGQSELPEGSFVASDYTYIRVFRMGKSSIVPAEAVAMDNGFYRLAQGVNTTYYFTGSYATYKFVVYSDSAEASTTEGVITSAKEVTDFTE